MREYWVMLFFFLHVVEYVLHVFVFFELVEEFVEGFALFGSHFLYIVGNALEFCAYKFESVVFEVITPSSSSCSSSSTP